MRNNPIPSNPVQIYYNEIPQETHPIPPVNESDNRVTEVFHQTMSEAPTQSSNDEIPAEMMPLQFLFQNNQMNLNQ